MDKLTLEELEALPKELLTPKQICFVLGISPCTFYRSVNKMPFPVLKFGKHYKIPKQPFLDYVRSGQEKSGK